MKLYRSNLGQPARALRKKATAAEIRIWARIRRKQIGGVQFYRQKPLASFIVDFYCAQANLVIEIDGAQHLEKVHAEQDMFRDECLRQMGLEILRFSNHEVMNQTDEVIQRIRDEVQHRIGRE